MRVAVYLSQLNAELREKIAAHIQATWSDATIKNETHADTNARNEASLLICDKGSPEFEKTSTLREIVVVRGLTIEQTLFLVDAKLGKLTNFNSISAVPKAPAKSTISRRQFLLGSFAKPAQVQHPSVIVDDSCEAKFGCSTCVDACPAPGALKIENKSIIVSGKHCIECGICAGVCPVSAIQMRRFPEDAYRGLLKSIHDSPAPTKTLVITCNRKSVAQQPWMDIEEVHGIGFIGARQLAIAAGSSIGALLVYCPDGLCAGKEHTKQAAELISSIMKDESAPVFSYLEGKEGALQINEIHKSARARKSAFAPSGTPWKDYVRAIKSILNQGTQAEGLGLTEMEVSDSCTLCYACVESCPHQALAIDQDKLNFQPDECTGCGYCEQICPERSITLSEMGEAINLTPRTVYKDEMIRCARCNTPYVSAKMFKKVSQALEDNKTPAIRLCQSCRQDEAYKRILGGPQGEN